MIVPAEYGRALWILSSEDGTQDAVFESLSGIMTLLSEYPDYAKLLDTPAIAAEEKHALIASAFGECEQNVKNFMMLLCDRREVCQFPACYRTYESLYREAMGITEAVCTTATPLSDAQRNALCQKIADMTGKRVTLREQIDPSLIGGIVLHVDGKQLDGSVKTRLDSFKAALAGTIL